MHQPDVHIIFQNMRMLQNLCLLPNRHLLIEGGLLDQVVEVYEMQSDAGIGRPANGLLAVRHELLLYAPEHFLGRDRRHDAVAETEYGQIRRKDYRVQLSS